MIGPWPSSLNTMQALNTAEVVYRGAVWRLATCLVLHAGVLHLAFNLSVALRYGARLEYAWGRGAFAALLLGAGLLGSVYSAVLLPDALSVGASGALMGALGAYTAVLAMAWREGGEEERASRRRALLSVCLSAAIVAVVSLVPFVDWAAHVFGYVGGLLLAFAFYGHLDCPPGGGSLDGVALEWPERAAEAAQGWGVGRATAGGSGAGAGKPGGCCARGGGGGGGGGGAPASCSDGGGGGCGCCVAPVYARRRLLGAVLYAIVAVAGALALALRTQPDRGLLG